MGEHHFLICRKHFERMDIAPTLRRHDVDLVPLVDQTLKEKQVPDLTIVQKIKAFSWLKELLLDVLKFQERHKGCEVVLTSDYLLDFVGEDERHFWQVEWGKPFHSKGEFDRKVKREVDALLEENYQLRLRSIILYSEKLGIEVTGWSEDEGKTFDFGSVHYFKEIPIGHGWGCNFLSDVPADQVVERVNKYFSKLEKKSADFEIVKSHGKDATVNWR